MDAMRYPDSLSIDAHIALLCRDVMSVVSGTAAAPPPPPPPGLLPLPPLQLLRRAVPEAVAAEVCDVLAEVTLMRHIPTPHSFNDSTLSRRIDAASASLRSFALHQPPTSPQSGLCHSPGGNITLAQRFSVSPEDTSAKDRLNEKRSYNDRLEAYLKELRLEEEGGGGGGGSVREEEESMFLTVNVQIAGLSEEHQVTVRASKTAHSLLHAFSEALQTMYSVDVRPMQPILIRDTTGEICPGSQGLGLPPLSIKEGETLSIVARDAREGY